MKFKSLITLSIMVFGNFSTAQADVIFYSGFEYLIKLNDTGRTIAGNFPDQINFVDCNSNIQAPQDCHLGRDVTHPDNSDGYAGFSFTKLDASGNPLADQSADYETTPWACVQDNVTGLVWEVKTLDDGLHHAEHTYTWYDTDNTTNGGNPGWPDGQNNGTADGGNICYGYNAADPTTFCNTEAYTARVNAQGLCGETDWRLPDVNELDSINLYRKSGLFDDGSPNTRNPPIDMNYFPNTVGGITNHLEWIDWMYWASTPSFNSYVSGVTQAWTFDYYEGYSRTWDSNHKFYVRLVRGGQ